jgi:hypothetical protein
MALEYDLFIPKVKLDSKGARKSQARVNLMSEGLLNTVEHARSSVVSTFCRNCGLKYHITRYQIKGLTMSSAGQGLVLYKESLPSASVLLYAARANVCKTT